MSALSAAAQQAGIPILCEMGLDPGMDHMSAMKVIEHTSDFELVIATHAAEIAEFCPHSLPY